MDELADFNRQRWNALVQAGIEYSRPFLELDEHSARQELDPYGILESVKDLEVLVLAGGGGQQSAAFATLGARVTVFDLSDAQLENDRRAAAHYGYDLRVEQGDMRDLSRFPTGFFDIVFQPYSINFVPDAMRVICEVARILRPGGLYRLDFANPFVMGVDEREWDGRGYPLRGLYCDGELYYDDPDWDVWDEDGNLQKVPGPREFRHTLSAMLNGMIAAGFSLLGLWEVRGDPGAEPGTWGHFTAVAPPWFHVWWRKQSLD